MLTNGRWDLTRRDQKFFLTIKKKIEGVIASQLAPPKLRQWIVIMKLYQLHVLSNEENIMIVH